MGQVFTKNEGFSDFCEGRVPFLLEIKQKAGWLVGMVQSPNYSPKRLRRSRVDDLRYTLK